MPNLLINAGPGCGKTHSITDAYTYTKTASPENWAKRFGPTDEQVAIYEWTRSNWNGCKQAPIYMAFNNDIVEDILKKAHPDCKDNVKTNHGWGYYVIRKKKGYLPLVKDRGEKIVQQITQQPIFSLKNKFDWVSSLRFVDKLKMELLPVSEENMHYLQNKYADLAPFKIHKDIVPQCNQLIQRMKEFDYKSGVNHTDQLWLALFLLHEPMFEWGFVDECQDLSPLELELALRMCKNLIFVGDENQGVNAWKGADIEAIPKIRNECHQELSLKTSFRLRPNHAEYANRIRPTANIKTLPGKTDGIHTNVDQSHLFSLIEEKLDKKPMLLCRYNAPLVKLAFNCTKRGIPVRITGSQVIENLMQTVKNRNATSMSDLQHKLAQFEKMCLQNGDDMAKEVTRDKFEAIQYILEAAGSVDAFETIAKGLLAPQKNKDALSLLTIHRSKGLENENVFVITPIESSKAKTPAQKEQEKNVHFVAATRSKENLYFVS